MNERPILFSALSVRAILAGTKTQTRRVAKMTDRARSELAGPCAYVEDQGLAAAGSAKWHARLCNPDVRGLGGYHATCPYGVPGDRLWVRETWAHVDDHADHGPHCIQYRADVRSVYDANRVHAPWRPSIHMPRWASRITLEVESVRVERLHAITEEDARAEGCESFLHSGYDDAADVDRSKPARANFKRLWDEINGKRAPWSASPWVWCLSFRRLP